MMRAFLLLVWALGTLGLAQNNLAQAVQRTMQLGGNLEQWQDLPQYPIVLSNSLPAKPVNAKGYFSLAWDEQNLYVLGVFEQDAQTLTARNSADTPQWWSDDAIELFFRPDPKLVGGVFHYAVNPKGVRFKMATSGDGFRSAARQEDKRWIVELAFPWSQNLPKPKSGTVWNLKVGREHQKAGEYPVWPKGGDFNASNNFGSLVFTQKLESDAVLQSKIATNNPVASTGPKIKSRLANIGSYAVYYGTNRAFTDQLVNFDLAIVQPNTVKLKNLKALQAEGVKVVAYLSIGEAEGSMVGLPKAWILGTNPNWGSKFMDAGQNGWRETIYKWAKDILDIGFDGLFLDTVDTVDLFPKSKAGMVQMIQGLRKRFPNAVIVQNRGFAVLPETASLIDAVMFEDFSTTYDFKSQKYSADEGDPTLLKPYLERGLVVLALDYALPTQQEIITRAYVRAKQYGFIPYVTTISLNELYLPTP